MDGETEIGAEYDEVMKECEQHALNYLALADTPDHKNPRYSIPNLESIEQVRSDSELMLASIKWIKKAVSNHKSLLIEEGIKTPGMNDLVKETVLEALKTGYLFGELRFRFWQLSDVDRGRVARQHDERTLKRANAKISAKRAEFWRPYQREFQRLVSGGMKPAAARKTILDGMTKRGLVSERTGEPYTDEIVRRRLK